MKANPSPKVIKTTEAIPKPFMYLNSFSVTPKRETSAQITEQKRRNPTPSTKYLNCPNVVFVLVAKAYAKRIVSVVAEVLSETSARR